MLEDMLLALSEVWLDAMNTPAGKRYKYGGGSSKAVA
jgi:hypothetical protein